MSRLQHLRAEVGLVPARRGTLGLPYAGALLGGAAVAWALGTESAPGAVLSWTTALSLILWQPVVEETMFRGVVQGYLLQTRWGARGRAGLSVANGIASCLFVLAHLVHQPPLWAFGTLLPSLLFGLFRDRTGSLWPAIVLHAGFNAAFFAARTGI